MMLFPEGEAIMSDDLKYRYLLGRRLVPHPLGPIVLFVMLNPSTADAEVDDPTIRRCKAFARREGAEMMFVANLFALRSTDPKVLKQDYREAVGRENNSNIFQIAKEADKVIVAWGADFPVWRAHDVLLILKDARPGKPILCLGTAKGGGPRHPLYVKADQPFVEYPGL